MLLLPSNTPQFSPIENMFGYVKGAMKDYVFRRKEDTTLEIMRVMFGIDKARMQGYFKKTLQNMLMFWWKLDLDHLKAKIASTID